MNEILISYIEDLRDSIVTFNEALMKVQNGERDADTVNNIFRVAHTIKGNSAAMNFMKIQKVMHTMEDLLSEVRNGTREITDELTEALFACHDFLEDCLEEVQTSESDDGMNTEKLLGRLVAIKNNGTGTLAASVVRQIISAPQVAVTESQTESVKSVKPDISNQSGAGAESLQPLHKFPLNKFMSSRFDRSDTQNPEYNNSASTPVFQSFQSPPQPEIYDVDMGINMPANLWEILGENIKDGGYNAYKLEIKFMKNSAMKAVRAWMIFDRIDQSGILMYSNPPKINDNNFSASGETPFESDIIETVILCEKEISDLVEDLKDTADIESVDAIKLSHDDVTRKVEFVNQQKKVVDQMQEIGVQLLGIDLQYLNEEHVRTIIDKMNFIISSNIAAESNPVNIIAKRMSAAFEEAIKNKKKVSIAERENIIFLCHTLEECILSPDNLKDKNLISLMYRRLEDLIDVVTAPDKRVGEILTSEGLITSMDADNIAQKQKSSDENLKFGQIAVKEKFVSALDVVTALNDKDKGVSSSSSSAASQTAPSASKNASAQGESGFVRVPVSKVDSLIDMLSELLIYNSQLEQSAILTEVEDSKTANILSRTEKLIKEIQALSMSLRMIDVKQTFNRLTRIARDTATDLNKKIVVKLEGEDTEIDRSAVEKLFDPLMHMVRNSVSHGIEESEEDRITVGKRPEGIVTISGYSKRGNVYIDVRDDGRGINTKKVYEKAKKLGLINENKEYTEQEIYKFIFLPGFSTQENVNNISGRGVGMNVVEEVVNKLGGKIEIDSEMGMGSSFRIKLPINLAVVNGTIVEISGIKYIIPTMCVKKFFVAKDKDWVSLQGENRAIKLDDGSIISMVSKEKVFGIKDDIINRKEIDESREYDMVLLEIDQKMLVLHVDKIISRQDVVSKPLSTDYASVPYANSASILGDGIVSLILDIDAIFKISQPI
ncbi:MAG: chemotaxis protein CheA [Oscillospiraceae bacterium]|nr:chemotaxis protein CheA [Oscillospiraceae bacterium]